MSGNYGFRVRLLPNNTVGLLLTDVRGPDTPTAYLAQVDVSTGRRVGFYPLNSNSQAVVIPYDWQWMGDGMLLLAGKSNEVGIPGFQSYLARWDFRNTPLLAARAGAAATDEAALMLFPNPTAGAVAVAWQLPPGQRAGQVRVYSLLGQVVRAQALPAAAAAGRAEVAGLPPGIYLVRLLDAGGAGRGRAQRLVVRE